MPIKVGGGTGQLSLKDTPTKVKKSVSESIGKGSGVSGPSQNVLGQVLKSKKVTQMLGQISDPSMRQKISTLMSKASPEGLMEISQNSEIQSALEGTGLGDLLGKLSQGSGVLSGLSGLSSGKMDLTTALSKVGVDISQFTDIAEGAGLGSLSDGVEAFSAVADLVKTDSDDPSINTKRLNVAKKAVSALGGKGIVGIFDSVLAFFKSPGSDTMEGVLGAFKDLFKSDGFLDKIFAKLLDKASLKLFGKSFMKFIPMLSTVVETAEALNTLFKYLSGDPDVTFVDLLQESLDAVGAGVGSSILPVGGPLISMGLNMMLDQVKPHLT